MLSTYYLLENKITFPQDEFHDILDRLSKGLDVSSVRVHREFNKYKQGQRYKTPWGEEVIIINIRRISDIKQYEYYSHLTPHMKSQIGKTNKIDILTIRSANKQNINRQVTNTNDHWYRNNIRPGLTVLIVKKEHQQTKRLTKGVVQNILTNKSKHTRGIKVRLKSGEIGRVQKIL